ncbi:MAG TPA: hypothetical protein VJ739_12170 [Gemmataceae bacterium]|nr:hypothetical protein [Gemmataceae bacterium]
MRTVKARFDGRVFVPEQPVNLPVGYVLEVPIADVPAADGHQSALAELAGQLGKLPENPDWPADGAAQHDHYLYGTPKEP